jgi:prolyl oligopeptidase
VSNRLTLFISSILLFACTTTQPAGWQYPATRTQNLVEDYHGTKVAATYRWLEDDLSIETKTWTEAQNRLTFSFLDATGLRESLRKRLTELWNYPKYSAPGKRGTRYFYSKNDGLMNQSVIYVQESLTDEPRVLLDPNTLSEDGTTALSGGSISMDGKYFAYGISVHGSDRQEYHVRDIDTGEDLSDHIKWCRFSGLSWVKDSSGFYYNRFPEPGTVAKEDETNFNRVYWHKLGTSQKDDRLVFEMPDQKELGFHPEVTEDGRFLVLSVYHGTDPRNGLYYTELNEQGQPTEGAFTRLLEPGQSMYSLIENVADIFYIHTDRNAPKGRVIAIDTRAAAEKYWREVVSEDELRVIKYAKLAGKRLLVVSMEHAQDKIQHCELDGTDCVSIELPGIGSVGGLTAYKDNPEIFFPFMSFLQPSLIFRYDLIKRELTEFRNPEISFDPGDYVTRQVFFKSRDGTSIPMFLTHKANLKTDGEVPVLLYGYGGFNINMTPRFSVQRLVFIEAGGIYAQVNLRGGSEYGEDWHRAGMLEDKQNVFDDFIAAAEYLIAKGITKPAKIATLGGSNGGLLVAATMLQRPDLFGAVVCAVPVTDMLRYHRFTVGRYWIPEYGNAEKNPEHFKFMYAYSPLHNVKTDVNYPPILITTADTDDRVVPMHSRKFAATMQNRAGNKNPYLIRIETKAGHGAGKPTSKRIQEAADMNAFIFKFLGMELR